MAGAATLLETVLLMRSSLKEQCSDVLETLDQRLQDDEAAFEELAGRYETSLQTLRQQIAAGSSESGRALDALDTAVRAESERVAGLMNEARAASEAFQTSLEQSGLRFTSEQAEFTSALKETEHVVTEAFGTLDTHFYGWAQTTAQRLDDTARGVESLLQAIADFGLDRDAVFDQLKGTLQHAAQTLATADSTLVNEWRAATDQLNQGTDEFFLQHLTSALHGEVDHLSQALRQLRGDGDRLAQIFGGDIGNLLSSLREVSHLIDQIKPLLDAAEAIV
jgi:hypothetical protein